MTNRKLASIRTVKAINPIKGADRVECLVIDGWKSVAKKGTFSVGEKIVFCEVDSFLPLPHPAWNFLAEKKPTVCEGVEGVRLRTVVLCKQLSQGFAIKLSDLPEHPNFTDLPEGTDVTKDMGIIKWESPVPKEMAGNAKGGFPFAIPKTDEERIQNLVSEIPTEIAGHSFRRTMKLDGTSMTVYHFDGEYGVCGRNWNYYESESNALWYTARRYGVIEALEKLGMPLAVQGELMGPGICKNKEGLVKLDFFIFRIWHIQEGRFLEDHEKIDVIEKLRALGADMQVVPDLGDITFDENVCLDNLLVMANGPSLTPTGIKEGDVYHRKDGKFSFKVINDLWLQKYGE